MFNFACTVGKAARTEKRKAWKYKNLAVELSATYTNKSLATSHIKLRNNKTFHLEESAWGFTDHYFGEWIETNDTIYLNYSDNNHIPKCIESLILEKTKNREKLNSNNEECNGDRYWQIHFVSEKI